MAKKLVFVLVLAAIAAGGVCAQEEAPNVIMFLGSMLSYERILSPNLGIGAELAIDFIGMPSLYYDGEKDDTTEWVALLPFSMDAFVRYYPWAGKFFTQLGLGIQTAAITDGIPGTTKLDGFGFHAKAQVGWRLDIGQPNHWVFEAKLGPAISTGGLKYEGETVEKASFFMFSFPIQLGFGFKF
jgi:hypothetical protein